MNEWKFPTNVHGVRSFVGLATYLQVLQEIHQGPFSRGSCANQSHQKEYAVHLERSLPESL